MKERYSKGRKVEGEEGRFLVIAASASTDAYSVMYSSVSGPPALKYSVPKYSFFAY
jgi:hypothetical protein